MCLKEINTRAGGIDGEDGEGVVIVDDLADTGKTGRAVPCDAAKGAFCNCLCETCRPASRGYFRNRGEPGHLDLPALGYGAPVHAALA